MYSLFVWLLSWYCWRQAWSVSQWQRDDFLMFLKISDPRWDSNRSRWKPLIPNQVINQLRHDAMTWTVKLSLRHHAFENRHASLLSNTDPIHSFARTVVRWLYSFKYSEALLRLEIGIGLEPLLHLLIDYQVHLTGECFPKRSFMSLISDLPSWVHGLSEHPPPCYGTGVTSEKFV